MFIGNNWEYIREGDLYMYSLSIGLVCNDNILIKIVEYKYSA